ncbi:hypothetical protein WJX72_001053 [[Myrmecia] bisecta]|uniref:ShKT domain-containing protein n=1 Tax=[Myrmecia] bisecta TaxID=41462 RepID=A0AAW1Q0G1_9CHLO
MVAGSSLHCQGAEDRTDAFIGYQEAGKAVDVPSSPGKQQCIDKDPRCAKWAGDGECLANPYYMRSGCPESCQVDAACGTRFFHPQLAGSVSEEGTRQYITRYPNVYRSCHGEHFRKDPSLGDYLLPSQRLRADPWVLLGSIGVGTYLGNEDEETDEHMTAAVISSFDKGFNVIDTASNYRNGRSEVSVGHALNSIRTGVGVQRGFFFLSTKAGFMQADILHDLLAQGDIASSDVVGGSHCIHPSCLEGSLARSLASLNVQVVDLLYLHNAAELQIPVIGRETFLQRLRAAFVWCEEARKAGFIRSYGMATWDGFRRPPSDPIYVALADVVRLAEGVGGQNHGFRYVQTPINLGMPEAWREAWQPAPAAPSDEPADGKAPDLVPLVEAAGRLGLGVFASGPLLEGELLKNAGLLAKLDQVEELKNVQGQATKLLQFARSTPGVLAVMVGHKRAKHMEANVALARLPPLTKEQFLSVWQQMRS